MSDVAIFCAYFASKMSALGVPEVDILEMGGWETDHIMKSIYRHSMIDREEEAKREAARKFAELTFFMTNFMTKNVIKSLNTLLFSFIKQAIEKAAIPCVSWKNNINCGFFATSR